MTREPIEMYPPAEPVPSASQFRWLISRKADLHSLSGFLAWRH